MTLTRPTSDDGGTTIKFYKQLGLRVTKLTKSLSGQYSGIVCRADSPLCAETVSAQDNVMYSAKYYGIGPQIGWSGIWQVNQHLKLAGGGIGAFLAGYYTSSLNGAASATGPVKLGSSSLSSYSDSEAHSKQSWTPIIFEGDFSVIVDVINNQQKGVYFGVSAGVAAEYILPTFTMA